MLTINVNELDDMIAHLRETLERERELTLISDGEPVARLLPITERRPLESPASLRALVPMQPDSTLSIREDRDRRDT